MTLQTLIDFIKSNNNKITIGGLSLETTDGNDLDIKIHDQVFQWVVGINDETVLKKNLDEVYANTMDSFIPNIAKKYVEAKTQELNDKITELESDVSEKENLEMQLKIEKNLNKESENRIAELNFLKDFLLNRDLIIHNR
jgi:hypothetical protein